MKNSNDTIGNRNRDLPTCSAVPQPIAPPRAPLSCETLRYLQTFRKKILSPSSGYNSILELFTVTQEFLSSPVPAMTRVSVSNANI